MSNVKITLIVAKTKEEFWAYVRLNCQPGELKWASPATTRCRINDVEYIFVSDLDHIRGLRGVEFKYVGRWYERPDIDEIQLQEQIQGVIDGAKKGNGVPDKGTEGS